MILYSYRRHDSNAPHMGHYQARMLAGAEIWNVGEAYLSAYQGWGQIEIWYS